MPREVTVAFAYERWDDLIDEADQERAQLALEQTFHLPVAAQLHPERSPLRVLERLAAG